VDVEREIEMVLLLGRREKGRARDWVWRGWEAGRKENSKIFGKR